MNFNNFEDMRDELEEDLRGLKIDGDITYKDVNEYLKHFDKWAKTAQLGDTYWAQGFDYTYLPEYELMVWINKEQRDQGEPTYMTPTCSNTDLEAIKRECEKYDIESTGCIEIFISGEDDAILHYENDIWTEV